MSPEPDPLDALLDRWSPPAPPPAEKTAADVWQRIAVSEAPARTGWLAALHAAFARPSFAAAFVAACMLLGLFLAEVRRSRAQAEYSTALLRSYLHLVDPLLEAAGKAQATTSVSTRP